MCHWGIAQVLDFRGPTHHEQVEEEVKKATELVEKASDREQRQCTIPQEATSAKKPNNVIKGEFARPGQTDWAVLCSVKGVSTILVFWDGSENNPAALAPWKDSNYVQNVGGGRWGYSRIIEPMSMADIVRDHDLEHLGIPLPPIDHQGIDDGFEGKAFLVWYYFDGQWLKVAGGD